MLGCGHLAVLEKLPGPHHFGGEFGIFLFEKGSELGEPFGIHSGIPTVGVPVGCFVASFDAVVVRGDELAVPGAVLLHERVFSHDISEAGVHENAGDFELQLHGVAGVARAFRAHSIGCGENLGGVFLEVLVAEIEPFS